MCLKVSKFVLITLLIYFIGITIAKPKGENDSETPNERERDSGSEKTPEENIEDSTLKAVIEKELEDIEKEVVSDMAPVITDMMELEKESEEKMAEDIFSSEKPAETEDDSITSSDVEKEPKNEPQEEKPKTTPVAIVINTGETTIEKEEAPKDTFAVWSAKGKICLLAKFHAVFSILYSSQKGEEKAEITLPKTANSKGKCGSLARLPLLQLSWEKYAFTMMFNKTDEENWAVTSMELTYDTAEPLFDEAVNAGKKTARSKVVTLFETPLKNSYFCPAQEVVLLYAGNKQVVTARIRDLQLQPYEIENKDFSPTWQCDKVIIEGVASYMQDTTVPLAVWWSSALVFLIIMSSAVIKL